MTSILSQQKRCCRGRLRSLCSSSPPLVARSSFFFFGGGGRVFTKLSALIEACVSGINTGMVLLCPNKKKNLGLGVCVRLCEQVEKVKKYKR